MQQAIDLAKLGKGHTFPNPAVGCVIVKNNEIISTGFHECYGGYHAEKNAILNAKESLTGASLYVNLEPCAHFGKQPPCCNLIVESKLSKVFYSSIDPNPQVASQGVEYLEKHGVKTYGNILAKKAFELNEAFFYHTITGKPLVAAKWAQSIDGKIFTYTKESKWITGEKSRQYVHELRNNHQAIMVGANTLNADNPQLNVRMVANAGNPIKIIVSSTGNINLHSRIFNDNNNIIIGTTEKIPSKIEAELKTKNCQLIKTTAHNNQVNLEELLIELGKLGIISVFIEGGAELLKSFILQNLINKAFVFIAPTLISGNNNSLINENIFAELKNTPKYILKDTQIFDNDILIEYLAPTYNQWKDLCLAELLKKSVV